MNIREQSNSTSQKRDYANVYFSMKILEIFKYVITFSSVHYSSADYKVVYTKVVQHVTGNDKDYLRKIPRVVW